jgi:hypothetical protein
VDEVRAIAEQSVAQAQEVAGTAQQTVEVSRVGQEAAEQAIVSMRKIRRMEVVKCVRFSPGIPEQYGGVKRIRILYACQPESRRSRILE